MHRSPCNDIASAALSGLTPQTVYYVNVLVRDVALNQSVYNTVMVTTSPDIIAPIPGSAGQLLVSKLRKTGFTVGWTVASDDFTNAADLEYKVVYSTSNNLNSVTEAEANGTVVADWTRNFATAVVTGLTPKKNYYVNVLVRDQGGNKAVYSMAAGMTAVGVHIAYTWFNSSDYDLRYQSDVANGSMSMQVVDSANGVDPYMVRDSDGNLHIAYIKGTTSGAVGWARKISGSWTTSSIYANTSQFTALALNPQTNYIATSFYRGSTSKDLYWSVFNGSSWSTAAALYTSGTVGQYSRIALDSDNKSHICSYDSGNTNLLYTTNVSGSWVTRTIDSAGTVGRYCAIVVDSNNAVHITYYDGSNANLKYATNASGSWVLSVLDGASTSTGSYVSMAIDPEDNLHVAYYETTGKTIKYLKFDSSTGLWNAPVTAAAHGTNSLAYTSIAIGSDGLVHIAYQNSTLVDLMYVYGQPGDWVVSTVESTASSGRSPCIVAE